MRVLVNMMPVADSGHRDTIIGGVEKSLPTEPDTVEDLREDLRGARTRIVQLEASLRFERERADRAEAVVDSLVRSIRSSVAQLSEAVLAGAEGG